VTRLGYDWLLLFFSKRPSPAAMHLTALSLLPRIVLFINLGNLPGDIGLQLVKGGRAWAVDLGLEEAPEAEVEGGARSIPYSRKVIPNSTDNLIAFKSIQRERQSSQ